MRTFLFLLAVLLAQVAIRSTAIAEEPGSGTTPSPRPKLDLPRLLELARKRSPLVAQAHAQVAVRDSQRLEADMSWWPTGSLTAGISPAPSIRCRPPSGAIEPMGAEAATAFRRDNCLSTVDGSGRELTGNTITNSILAIDGAGFEVSLNLTQPLFTFGKIEYGKRAALAGIEAEEARTDAARYETDLQVMRAYFGLKAARASNDTASEVRDQLRKWVDKIEADLDADKPKYNFAQSDLSRLRVALAQVEILVGEFERLSTQAERGLAIAAQEPIDIDDEELAPLEVIDQPLEYYEREALLHRPEVRALEAGSRAYRALQKQQIGYMLPDLGLNFSLLFRGTTSTIEEPSNAFMNHFNAYGAGLSLGLRQPIDFGVRWARYARARADADAFDAQQKAALALFQFEITQAWSNLREARKRMATIQKAQRQAQGWMTSMEQKLDLAITDAASAARDFVEAARNYFDLRLRYYQSIYDVNLQIAQLRRATGVEVAR